MLQFMGSQRVRQTEYSIVYMYHKFLIHSSADRHLGCFHDLAIVNSAVMNIGYICLFQFWFPRCVCPALGLLGHIEPGNIKE